MDMADSIHRSSVFSRLKPYCLELFELLQNPSNHNSSAIPSLLEFLRACSSTDLQPFVDYASFPLLLLLDAAVECRSSKEGDPEQKRKKLSAVPHRVSDKVAEGVVLCLEELFQKSRFGFIDQMVLVMKKLTHAAMLSPLEASEEFREGVIRCFGAVLRGLRPCADEACSCRQTYGVPALVENGDVHSLALRQPLSYDTEGSECLIAFLQSHNAAAAIGHWFSLLLQAADTEAARGHRGSARLRVEAFSTLRVLVAKVGTADVLAFFLPGVVSKFSKVLHSSKTMMSGAAGSMDATDQAIRALAEYLMIVLDDDSNLTSSTSLNSTVDSGPDSNDSVESVLDQLRQLPISTQGGVKNMTDESMGEADNSVACRSDFEMTGAMKRRKASGSLHVERTTDWLQQTSANVVKLLNSTFPQICVHPAKRLRRGLLAAITAMLSRCSSTLKESRLMLLECLFVLVVDDSEDIAAASQEFLHLLFSTPCGKHSLKTDIAQIFARLIDKLPKVVLGGEESAALFHAQQLLVVIYYSGPEYMLDHLQNPVTAARLLDVFALCLSQNSVYTGTLDKLMSTRTSSISFLPSILELRGGPVSSSYQNLKDNSRANVSNMSVSDGKKLEYSSETLKNSYELPRMPPWFVHVGSKKLYDALAAVLRLIGLSLLADHNEGHMAVITDIPLGHIRRLVSEVRSKDYTNESWQSWCNRSGSGKLIRQASTSACILNEMIFGISDKAVDGVTMMFQKSRVKGESMVSIWKASQKKVTKSHLIDCVGRILHEYLSSELWVLPVDHGDLVVQNDTDVEISLHFFRDAAALQQVAIDGVGIFATCIGNEFSLCGFLHSTLYLLLENVISADNQVRTASDAVLHILAASCGHSTVGDLVLTNADYVVDSICRQLRHLNLNPQVPNVLASMLSYIGVAHKVLSLLEETMCAVSRELEILGRHQHPKLTTPFLKAIAEIAKASKSETSSLPSNAELYLEDVKSKSSRLEKKARAESSHKPDGKSDSCQGESEQWVSIVFKWSESKRYRRTVGSIAASCLSAATPLLASMEQTACLVALDIVQDSIASLAKVEEAYQYEQETKELIEEVVRSYSIYELHDTMDAADEGTDENRLLPAMNKIWPYLISCVRNRNPVAVRKCASVIANVVQICGGDFFSRRFHTDGPCLWKLLSSSPFQKKPVKEERTPLLLPYRSNPSTDESSSVAEVSNLKVQVALLNMISDLARNKRSSTALEVVLKKVSGLVVGIACSGVAGLHDASISALHGLALMDPDLIWLLVADVYYSVKKEGEVIPPPGSDFPQLSRLLPPPEKPKDYLYVQYGGQSYGFGINLASVEKVFLKLHSLAFPDQLYL
ncbi:unnamed protein product [Linum trigynum]|uniref:ARM repeat superfamily protein n=1 Tax=Linum trigynum TaxID=586398 RepID=A0AAV2GFC3_9ROSI